LSSIHDAKINNNIGLLKTQQYYLIRRGKGVGLIYKKKGRHESLAPASQRIMLINVRFCQI
ncbi:hypothetical protein, partial [Leyella stercorea]|uniref:hypothetical protein n=1 Tax=Leyella stercorea TaxID=363265 RepID=UPI001F445917